MSTLLVFALVGACVLIATLASSGNCTDYVVGYITRVHEADYTTCRLDIIVPVEGRNQTTTQVTRCTSASTPVVSLCINHWRRDHFQLSSDASFSSYSTLVAGFIFGSIAILPALLALIIYSVCPNCDFHKIRNFFYINPYYRHSSFTSPSPAAQSGPQNGVPMSTPVFEPRNIV